MPRLLALASLAVLALGAAAASAQETGGVALTPEVMKTENAQGIVLDHVLGRVQALQQLRALTGAAPTAAAALGGTAALNNPQPAAVSANDPLALARALRRRRAAQSSATDPVVQQQIINSTENLSITKNSLTVNAQNSPVVLGSNNIVHQQATTSVAVATNGNATADATSVNGGPAKRHRRGGGQTAASDATSIDGGTAQAASSNSEVVPR
jgi:hypothetical protein